MTVVTVVFSLVRSSNNLEFFLNTCTVTIFLSLNCNEPIDACMPPSASNQEIFVSFKPNLWVDVDIVTISESIERLCEAAVDGKETVMLLSTTC